MYWFFLFVCLFYFYAVSIVEYLFGEYSILMFLKRPSSCFLFLVDYILKTILASQQNWVEVQYPYIFLLPLRLSATSLTIHTIDQSSAFATVNEPTLAHHYHQSAIYISDHSWYCTSHGFRKLCNDMYPPLQCVIHSSFIPLIILCSVSV